MIELSYETAWIIKELLLSLSCNSKLTLLEQSALLVIEEKITQYESST